MFRCDYCENYYDKSECNLLIIPPNEWLNICDGCEDRHNEKIEKAGTAPAA